MQVAPLVIELDDEEEELDAEAEYARDFADWSGSEDVNRALDVEDLSNYQPARTNCGNN